MADGVSLGQLAHLFNQVIHCLPWYRSRLGLYAYDPVDWFEESRKSIIVYKKSPTVVSEGGKGLRALFSST